MDNNGISLMGNYVGTDQGLLNQSNVPINTSQSVLGAAPSIPLLPNQPMPNIGTDSSNPQPQSPWVAPGQLRNIPGGLTTPYNMQNLPTGVPNNGQVPQNPLPSEQLKIARAVQNLFGQGLSAITPTAQAAPRQQVTPQMLLQAAQKTYGDTPLAKITAAQAMLESGFPGRGSGLAINGNNLFGIKGTGTAGSIVMPTHEFVNGKMITVNAPFARNQSIEDSFVQHAHLLQNPRYNSVRNASTVEEAARALQKSGYATDPNYANKLIDIANKYFGKGVSMIMPKAQAQIPNPYNPTQMINNVPQNPNFNNHLNTLQQNHQDAINSGVPPHVAETINEGQHYSALNNRSPNTVDQLNKQRLIERGRLAHLAYQRLQSQLIRDDYGREPGNPAYGKPGDYEDLHPEVLKQKSTPVNADQAIEDYYRAIETIPSGSYTPKGNSYK